MKVAIVGSGISGLTAAFALGQAGHNVTLIEGHAIPGMDAHSVDLPNGERLDTPPRSINAQFYTNLLQTYRQAGVELEPFCWDFSFNEHVEGGDSAMHMCLATLWGRAIPVRGAALLGTLKSSAAAVKLYTNIERDLRLPSTHSMDFGTWLNASGPYCQKYLTLCLLPALATWLSASFDGVLRYPAVILMDFIMRHSMTTNYHTKYGSCDAVKKLTQHVSCLHTNTLVTQVQLGCDGTPPSVTFMHKETQETCTQQFDAVILATEARQAAKLMAGAAEKLTAALNSITHERSEVVIHTDPKQMPSNRSHWMPSNFFGSPARQQGSCTLWFQIPGSPAGSNNESAHDASHWSLFQTWNPLSEVDKECVLSRYAFDRPMVTLSSEEVTRVIWAHQGQGGVYLIGAYTHFTVPLQESAALSALRVSAALGAAPSWWDATAAANPFKVPCTCAEVAADTAAFLDDPPAPLLPQGTTEHVTSIDASREEARGSRGRIQPVTENTWVGSAMHWISSYTSALKPASGPSHGSSAAGKQLLESAITVVGGAITVSLLGSLVLMRGRK